jgi:hypothetical protein
MREDDTDVRLTGVAAYIVPDSNIRIRAYFFFTQAFLVDLRNYRRTRL